MIVQDMTKDLLSDVVAQDTTIEYCIAYCLETPTCLAIDFDGNKSTCYGLFIIDAPCCKVMTSELHEHYTISFRSGE